MECFENCHIQTTGLNCWYSSTPLILILFKLFALFRHFKSKKIKRLELTDEVKGIQCNLSFCTRDERVLSSNFVSKIFALLFLFLKINACHIVNRNTGEQKQWTKIVLIAVEINLVDFRLSCKKVLEDNSGSYR